MDPQPIMKRLSDRLGLMDESQDWGIVNGSSERYEEFVRIYVNENLSDIERSAMAELVLASANERLVEDPAAELTALTPLLPRITHDARWELDYWRGLDPESFPLSGWLERHP